MSFLQPNKPHEISIGISEETTNQETMGTPPADAPAAAPPASTVRIDGRVIGGLYAAIRRLFSQPDHQGDSFDA